MVLQDFVVGADIVLEIVHGEKTFEIPSKVIGLDPSGILVPTFAFGGKTLDFTAREFSGIIFNLYGTELASGSRYCWKTVKLIIKRVQGVDYYLVASTNFGRLGAECDRRTNQRIALNISGGAVVPNANMPIAGTVLNVSNVGIAFYSAGNFAEVGSPMQIQFQDRVGEHDFILNVDVKCVRKMPKDSGFFYGCRTMTQTKEFQTYVFLKQLRQQTVQ